MWDVVDGEIRTIKVGERLSSDRYFFEGEVLTVRGFSLNNRPTTYTFSFYSEATNFYEESLWAVHFIVLPALVIGVIFSIWKAKKKRAQPDRIGNDL